MVALVCALMAMTQPSLEQAEASGSETWTAFYLDAARQYKVTGADDDQPAKLNKRALFDWASIDDFNGAVFAWTENGRPALVATIFSFPQGAGRLAVHEFVSLSENQLKVEGPGGAKWDPPPLASLQLVPEAEPPPGIANLLKLHCRRLAKDFSAHMNRRGERWDLRLLPTPLLEYRDSSEDVLGGALFAFVGYSTDPEILLLIEARKTAKGSTWHYQPFRFSDKSLYLRFKDKPVWESLRTGHGTKDPSTDDPHYRMLHSERLSPEIVERLSKPAAKE